MYFLNSTFYGLFMGEQDNEDGSLNAAVPQLFFLKKTNNMLAKGFMAFAAIGYQSFHGLFMGEQNNKGGKQSALPPRCCF